MAIKKIHIIINPASGKKEAILPVLNEVFKEGSIDWDVSITKAAGDGTELTKEALKKGVDSIGVYGGDGTLMEVVSGMVGSDIPLAILPGGTANVMSKELGIPQSLPEACKLLLDPTVEIRTVDVGQFDKRYFILRTSLGFEAQMVKGAHREAKNRFGVFAYALSAFNALSEMRPVFYKIIIDGKESIAKGLTCIVANSGNVGFANLSLDKNIDVSDGLLDILVVRQANFKLFTHIMATVIRRERPQNVELVKHWQGKEVSVISSPKQLIQCDGEIIKNVPLKVKIIPAALKVFVPAKKAPAPQPEVK